jgi:hypothetical protein
MCSDAGIDECLGWELVRAVVVCEDDGSVRFLCLSDEFAILSLFMCMVWRG